MAGALGGPKPHLQNMKGRRSTRVASCTAWCLLYEIAGGSGGRPQQLHSMDEDQSTSFLDPFDGFVSHCVCIRNPAVGERAAPHLQTMDEDPSKLLTPFYRLCFALCLHDEPRTPSDGISSLVACTTK